MSIDLTSLLIAWGIQLTGVLSPGPGVALILGVATAQGRKAAITTVWGIACAAIILAVLTVIGMAAFLADMREVMILIRLLGAAYLAYLAWGAFRRALNPPEVTAMEVASQPERKTFVMGFLMQMANPKAIFFWIAVAAVGSLEQANAATLGIFLLGAFVISFTGHGAWALVLSSNPMRRAYQSARSWVEGFLGVFFATAAVNLALSRS